MNQQITRSTSGFAIAALVTGIVSIIFSPLALLAVPFGIIGIVNTGPNNANGRGMAIAGLVLGCIGIAIGVCMVVFMIAGLALV